MHSKSLFCGLAAIALATFLPVAATAQEASGAASVQTEIGADAPAASDAADAPAAADPAEAAPAAPAEPEFITEAFGDWELRCTPDKADCFLYQLLRDQDDNPVVEFSMIKLPAEAEATAGATVVTPLGTLLTAGLSVQVDSNAAATYPFNWCTRSGCFARFGVDDGGVSTLKRGAKATVTLRSIGLPEEPVVLTLSLTGFTAAYDALVAATGG